MTGKYVETNKSLPQSYKWRSGNIGQVGFTYTRVIPSITEYVYSWRTLGVGADEDRFMDEEFLRREAKVTRNGFVAGGDPVYDQGHEFRLMKNEVDPTLLFESYLVGSWSSSDPLYFYRGPLVLGKPSSGGAAIIGAQYPTLGWMTSNESTLLGQRAVQACSPTAPEARLATFTGEALRDLPAMFGAALLKERALNFKSIGGEYLNVQFGWLPFVSDLRKMVNSLRGASRTITQMHRDSGRLVRRRMSFPTTVSSTSRSYDLIDPYLPFLTGGAMTRAVGEPFTTQVTEINRVERSSWFSGAFTYYLPDSDGIMSKLRTYEALANKLLGTRITPDVLWEVAPWSWLVDWGVGIQDALRTASLLSSDGLVIRWGYLMTTTVSDTLLMWPGRRLSTGYRIPPLSQRWRTTTKERVRATPYGFGVSLDSLSDFQWSILAALGMTRAPRSLR